MSKAILISIKPKWVAKILNGEKTIEIRKTMPKCDLPIDVYIYCAKDINNGLYWAKEWVCVNQKQAIPSIRNGKVVAKFTLNKVEHFEYDTCSRDISGYWLDNGEVFKNKGTCLKSEELFNYIKSGEGYAWYIDNLVIFDEPKELSEFKYIKKYRSCNGCPHNFIYFGSNDEVEPVCRTCQELKPLTKAPQSWCYVEVNENE